MKEKHHFRLPPIGMRVFKTLLSVLLVTLTYDYLLGGRNACFACIGAVYAIGNHFHEGFKFGFNRFVGTLFGGLIVIPFYWLYYNQPLGIPKEVYLVLGLLCLMYLHHHRHSAGRCYLLCCAVHPTDHQLHPLHYCPCHRHRYRRSLQPAAQPLLALPSG